MLLTNEARRRRNLALYGDCESYVGEMETTLLVVRDCSHASDVWQYLIPSHLMHKFFSLALYEWVVWNLDGLEMRGFHKEWGGGGRGARMAICC